MEKLSSQVSCFYLHIQLTNKDHGFPPRKGPIWILNPFWMRSKGPKIAGNLILYPGNTAVVIFRAIVLFPQFAPKILSLFYVV